MARLAGQKLRASYIGLSPGQHVLGSDIGFVVGTTPRASQIP